MNMKQMLIYMQPKMGFIIIDAIRFSKFDEQNHYLHKNFNNLQSLL